MNGFWIIDDHNEVVDLAPCVTSAQRLCDALTRRTKRLHTFQPVIVLVQS